MKIEDLIGKTVAKAHDKWGDQPDRLEECYVIEFTDGTVIFFESDHYSPGNVLYGIENKEEEE